MPPVASVASTNWAALQAQLAAAKQRSLDLSGKIRKAKKELREIAAHRPKKGSAVNLRKKSTKTASTDNGVPVAAIHRKNKLSVTARSGSAQITPPLPTSKAPRELHNSVQSKLPKPGAGGVTARHFGPALGLAPFRAAEDKISDALALDCEMVGVGSSGTKSALAQVVILNENEELVYSAYVRPIEKITDYRTAVSGVRPFHMKTAVPFLQVQKEVGQLLRKRIVIGHALRNDFKVLMLSHPKNLVRDTALFGPFKEQGALGPRQRKLKVLAEEILGLKIQTGEHNPAEDALAALRLYKLHQGEFEREARREQNRNAARSGKKRK